MKTMRKFLLLLLVLLLTVLPGITAMAADGYTETAGKTQMNEVLREGMEPVTADELNDGEYEIEVTSSSSFFKIPKAFLTVKNGTMTAKLVMTSGAYKCIFLGTGEEAAKASESDYIFIEDDGTDYVVTIPVEALSSRIPVASFSKKKKKWYDRNLLFDASSLPAEALKTELPAYGELLETESPEAAEEEDPEAEEGEGPDPCEVTLPDGEYSIEVSLSGGSGRASVSTPTWFYVRDGKAYAKLLWSSTYYDYMILDDVVYYNETTDGSNSTFTIPVTSFDEEIDVIADTTAMGDPVEIEYRLIFYYDTIGGKGQVPQEAAKRVLMIAAAIIVFGGILNAIVKKKSGRS